MEQGTDPSRLPPEIWGLVFTHLDLPWQALARYVCHLWHDLIQFNEAATRAMASTFAAGGHPSCLLWLFHNTPQVIEVPLLLKLATTGGHLAILKALRERDIKLYSFLLSDALRGGHIEVALWLRENGCAWDQDTCGALAALGRIDVFEEALRNGCPLNNNACLSAAAKGHIHILDWLKARGCSRPDLWDRATADSTGFKKTFKWLQKEQGDAELSKKSDTTYWAARWGNLRALKWLIKRGWPCTPAATHGAATIGRLDILEYLHVEKGIALSQSCIYEAGRDGHLEVIKWLVAHGAQWDKGTGYLAAAQGHLMILQFIHAAGCPMGASICEGAAWYGHLELLQWLRSVGTPWEESTFIAAARAGHIPILEWLENQNAPVNASKAFEMCLLNARFLTFRWLLERGYTCPPNVMQDAARKTARLGLKDVLVWLASTYRPGPPLVLEERLCSSAAGEGWQHVVQWLREVNCPWDKYSFNHAVKWVSTRVEPAKHLPYLQWLKERSCPWDATTFKEAASTGCVDLLKWMRDNGCPFDETACQFAAYGGHLEALKWLAGNNFPLKPSTPQYATLGSHLDVMKWLLKEGYDWPAEGCKNLGYRSGEIAQWLKESGGCPCQKFEGFCPPILEGFAYTERMEAMVDEEDEFYAPNAVEEKAKINEDSNEATGGKEGTREKKKKKPKKNNKDPTKDKNCLCQ